MSNKSRISRLLIALVAILLLALVIVSMVSIRQIQTLSLPISKAIGFASLLLPVATALSLQGGSELARVSASTSHRKDRSLSWSAVAIFVVLTIYETVIVTLSLTHMVPPSDLTCHLDRQWQQMYSSKKSESIKRIQDTYNCCGLHSAKDRAWPIPAKDRAVTACSTTFGRDKSCFGSWRRDEQITAGLFLLVALTTFMVKVFAILFVRPNIPWTYSRQSSTSIGEVDEPTPKQQNQARIEGPYHDDEAPAPHSGAAHAGHNRALTVENGRVDGDDHTGVLLPLSRPRMHRDGSEWI